MEEKLRNGFTTGSCAAAAAKAACYMLLTGRKKEKIDIITPKGITFHASIVDILRGERAVQCAVIKDGGDDPDIYDRGTCGGKSSFLEGQEAGTEGRILIDGGIGVGRVTSPGLDQPVGNAAINHVPREMIEREMREVCHVLDYHEDLAVEISVPEGQKLANPPLIPDWGILGGIST